MDVIHLNTYYLTDNWRNIRQKGADYENLAEHYACAYPAFNIAHKAAVTYLKNTLGYLDGDWRFEIEDHETEVLAYYNGGIIGQVTIDAYDFDYKA